MVISPMLRGMFGLQFDAQTRTLTFAPHIPADWKDFAIHHIATGNDSVDLQFSRSADSVTITAERNGSAELKMNFHPAVSSRAKVLSVMLNGRRVPFRLDAHSNDQHVIVETILASGQNTLKIVLRNDFAIAYEAHLPAFGCASQGLRIISETWSDSRDALTLETEGLVGHTYALSIWGKEQIKSIDGARLTPGGAIEETFATASGTTESQSQTITIHFIGQAQKPRQVSAHN
jgi:hypothetical protein